MLTQDPTLHREPAEAAPAAPARPGASPWRGGGTALLIGAAVAVAALSLLLDSAPTYDPWAWIIWGREITQLDLVTTTGPSWKPLPILFTTPFALFGEAAPFLWLVVARAGALVAVVLAYRLARALGAAVLPAAAGALGLATAPWWTTNAWLGNSEGMLVACLLGAALAHLAGRRRAAFWLGVAAALLRPEVWPFLGLYGLWLAWTRRGEIRSVAAGFALLPLLWLVPEQIGSGDFWRASSRAQTDLTPDAAGNQDDPAIEIFSDFAALLTPAAWAGVGLAVVVTIVVARGARRMTPAVSLTAVSVAWVAVVAVMAAMGYSGNQRYLIAPAALALVLAALGASALLSRLPGPLRLAAGAAAVVAFALPGLRDSLDAAEETAAQSRIPADLEQAVERAGGVDALERCGPLITEPLLVPQVAWHFGQHLEQIHYRAIRETGMVVQGQVSPHLRPFPDLGVYAGLPQRELATAPRWRIVAVGECGR